MRSTFKVLFYVKKGSEKPNGNLPHPHQRKEEGYKPPEKPELNKGKGFKR